METPEKSCGDPDGLHVSLPGPGYIANLVTEATGCGGVYSPWRVAAQPGQTIRLSLLDFTRPVPTSRRRCVQTTTRPPGELVQPALIHDARSACTPLAVVREPDRHGTGDWHNVTVSASSRVPAATSTSRENLVYVSHGHVLEIAILTSDKVADVPYFMMKYQGETLATSLH